MNDWLAKVEDKANQIEDSVATNVTDSQLRQLEKRILERVEEVTQGRQDEGCRQQENTRNNGGKQESRPGIQQHLNAAATKRMRIKLTEATQTRGNGTASIEQRNKERTSAIFVFIFDRI